MNKRIFGIAGFLILAIVHIGCKKDLLDKYPLDQVTSGNFFKDATSASKATAGCFFGLKQENWFYKRYFITWIDNMTDDSYSRKNQPWRIQLIEWSFDPTHYGFESWWRGYFQTINSCNFVIDFIGTSTDPNFTKDQQAKYIAVAKMLKGFSYINLTTLWGDVPYFPHFLTRPEEAFVKRTPKAEVLAAAIEDLKYAAEHLPASWQGADVGLPTKTAGAALLAKAYLYAKDYPNAAIAAKNALDIATAEGYRLMDSYEYMMSINSQVGYNNDNTEFIFTLNHLKDDPTNDNVNEMTVERGMGYGGNSPNAVRMIYAPVGGEGGWGYALPSRNLIEAFEPGDPRRKYSIWMPGDIYGTYKGPTVVENGITYNDGDVITYQAGWSASNTNTRKLYNSMRDQLNGDQANGYNIPLVRYADLLLFYAEALIEDGKVGDGMIQLNKVRARPSVNMPPLTASGKEDAREKLRHERRIELNMEGIRLFDLMRWGILKDLFGEGLNARPMQMVWGVDGPASYKGQNLKFPKNNLWPIPQAELDINKQSVQNPGY